MKVAILPTNIASEISNKVKSLRRIGVEAKGLTFSVAAVQESDGVEVVTRRRGELFYTPRAILRLCQLVRWADVVHWIWAFDSVSFRIKRFRIRKLDKFIVSKFNKPGVIQFCGSEIRNPEIDRIVNPYYDHAFDTGYEYANYESPKTSHTNQRDFADVGFYPLEFIGMERYFVPGLFERSFPVMQSVMLSEHEPSFPSVDNRRPLIIHSPTVPVAKGTAFVLAAVAELKTKYEFDFQLVQGMRRSDALKLMSRCDIFVDQLILGSHGLAAVEAMAFGKPVICYINEVIGKRYPSDLPIVNANPDDIASKLEILIKDAELRNRVGQQSRAYVEKYHDEADIAASLVRTYRQVIDRHKEKRKAR